MRALLVINPRAGSESPTTEELAQAARERGIEAHVLDEGDDPAEVAGAADVDLLGAAGGDGTVAAAAAVTVERDLPFVVVPFGTRNHFARDLGLDRDDPLAALAAFAGEERRVDVGRAGERRFLNNVSLGLYASLVHRREHHRRRRQALAGVRALWLGLRRRPGVWATIDGRPVEARVLLVANNAYELSLFSIGGATGSTRAGCTSTGPAVCCRGRGTRSPASASRSIRPRSRYALRSTASRSSSRPRSS
ncbi:MAG TPA: diacylglycerol kinase family protein [Gaiellaceae bacterium]|nr:diacylglycerol kinase family protein [Gaiellaceae bacterium]